MGLNQMRTIPHMCVLNEQPVNWILGRWRHMETVFSTASVQHERNTTQLNVPLTPSPVTRPARSSALYSDYSYQ